MNATEAKIILEAIPEERFITGKYTDGINCCAIGHLYYYVNENKFYTIATCCTLTDSTYSKLKIDPIAKLAREVIQNLGFHISSVNDASSEKVREVYKELTPKARVIHYLNDAIALGL